MTAVGEIDIVACGGSTVDPYILKARVQTPQIILNFRKQIGEKTSLVEGLTLAFHHNYVQSLLNSWIKTFEHICIYIYICILHICSIFST